MKVLNGSIDELLEKESRNIQEYLRGSKKLSIEINGQEKKMVEAIARKVGVRV